MTEMARRAFCANRSLEEDGQEWTRRIDGNFLVQFTAPDVPFVVGSS